MSRFTALLRRLGTLAAGHGDRGEEAYLSASADVHDLERRMRELDRHRHPGYINAYLSLPAGTGR
jgi:hypothetical protein